MRNEEPLQRLSRQKATVEEFACGEVFLPFHHKWKGPVGQAQQQ